MSLDSSFSGSLVLGQKCPKCRRLDTVAYNGNYGCTICGWFMGESGRPKRIIVAYLRQRHAAACNYDEAKRMERYLEDFGVTGTYDGDYGDNITVELSPGETQLMIQSLVEKLADTKQRMSSYRDVEEGPTALDTCCTAHRHRWQRRVDDYEQLAARRQALMALVDRLPHDLS